MKKIFLAVIIASFSVFLVYQVVIPKSIDNRKDEMISLLQDNGYKVISYNGCNGWINSAEFTVSKDSKPERTVHIKFASGAMVIQP